jgi:hypothetical protein
MNLATKIQRRNHKYPFKPHQPDIGFMAITRVDLSLSISVESMGPSEMRCMVENSGLRELIEYAFSVGHHITVAAGLKDIHGQDAGIICVSLSPSAVPCGERELYDFVISEAISRFKDVLAEKELPCRLGKVCRNKSATSL